MSLMLGMGLSLSALVTGVQAQSGSLEPPGSAFDNNGNPVATTQAPLSWGETLPTNERFTSVMGGAAVQDNETGLVWEQSPGETDLNPGITLGDRSPWLSARVVCDSRRVGNRKGWRLPSVHELASLLDTSNLAVNPALPVGHPFSQIQSSSYWSATIHATNEILAWDVDLGLALSGTSFQSNFRYVWCVRGGGPLSEY